MKTNPIASGLLPPLTLNYIDVIVAYSILTGPLATCIGIEVATLRHGG